MKIYLAGSRGNWREKFIEGFPTVEFINPFKNKEKQRALMDFASTDLEGVKNSDMTIIYINYHIFTGACVEAGYAYGLGKPIILIFEHKGYIDALLQGVSRKVFTDLESAIEWFKGYIKRTS